MPHSRRILYIPIGVLAREFEYKTGITAPLFLVLVLAYATQQHVEHPLRSGYRQ